MELVYFREEERPFAARWLPQLEAGGVQLQVCALFSDEPDLPELALRQGAAQGVREFDRAVAENPSAVAVRSRPPISTRRSSRGASGSCSRSRAWSRSATTPA